MPIPKSEARKPFQHDKIARYDATCQEGALGAVFDTRNVWYGAHDRGGRADFEGIIAELADGSPWRAVAVVVDSGRASVARFIAHLAASSIEAASVHPIAGAFGTKIPDDVAIAVEAMRLAYEPTISRIAIVSGDADMVPVARAVRSLGKTVTVAAFRGQLSSALAAAADYVLLLDARHVVSEEA